MDWIRCSERLPDKDGTYTTTRATNNGRYIDRTTFGYPEKAWVAWGHEVVAWLPNEPYYGPV